MKMMQRPNYVARDVSDSVGLLISILVRYPEVATIYYDPKAETMKFTFIYNPNDSLDSGAKCIQELQEHLVVYHKLEQKRVKVCELVEHAYQKVSMLEITRDIKSLSQDELALIVSLVTESLGEALVSEDSENLLEEDLQMQEEIIGHMLDSLQYNKQEKNLIAFREEGKVMVFNK